MEIIEQMGTLILGTRLKRISQRFQQDINKIYKRHNVEFEISWFPIFYLINQNGSTTISELSQKLSVTHPAVIQVVTILATKGLIKTTPDKGDLRIKNITLTNSGQKLLETVKPIWNNISKSMDNLLNESTLTKQLISMLNEFEKNRDNKGLFERYQDLEHEEKRSLRHSSS